MASNQSTGMPPASKRSSSPALQEPVAWYGPIVMNTQSELRQAFDELERGAFLKHDQRK